jgi:hypothetical protein
MKSLIVLVSHHNAYVIAKVLDAQVKTTEHNNPDELQQYDLIGFGSGIDSGKNYREDSCLG